MHGLLCCCVACMMALPCLPGLWQILQTKREARWLVNILNMTLSRTTLMVMCAACAYMQTMCVEMTCCCWHCQGLVACVLLMFFFLRMILGSMAFSGVQMRAEIHVQICVQFGWLCGFWKILGAMFLFLTLNTESYHWMMSVYKCIDHVGCHNFACSCLPTKIFFSKKEFAFLGGTTK